MSSQKPMKETKVIAQGRAERTCVYCGCAESRACSGGCAWITEHPATNTGVCTACSNEWAEEVQYLLMYVLEGARFSRPLGKSGMKRFKK